MTLINHLYRDKNNSSEHEIHGKNGYEILPKVYSLVSNPVGPMFAKRSISLVIY